MSTDPDPVEGISLKESHSSVAGPDSHGPSVAYFLETKGGVARIISPQAESNSCPLLYLGRQGREGRPEIRSRE
jgi:hypothetical protein